MKKQITNKAVLSVIDELAAKGEDGKTTTKAIVLKLGELFPDVHMKSVLVKMGQLKRDGFLKYQPSAMAWWLTADGRRVLKNG